MSINAASKATLSIKWTPETKPVVLNPPFSCMVLNHLMPFILFFSEWIPRLLWQQHRGHNCAKMQTEHEGFPSSLTAISRLCARFSPSRLIRKRDTMTMLRYTFKTSKTFKSLKRFVYLRKRRWPSSLITCLRLLILSLVFNFYTTPSLASYPSPSCIKLTGAETSQWNKCSGCQMVNSQIMRREKDCYVRV